MTRIEPRKLILPLILLLVVVAAAIGFSLTRMDDPQSQAEIAAEEEAAEATQNACASRTTFDGLKRQLFAKAGRGLTGDRTNFDILASNAIVRMEDPTVAERDESLDLTRCEGGLVLELPPGAERAFGGQRRLTADVAYEVQAAADGTGPVYRLSGADGIVAQLAAFDSAQLRRTPPAEDPLANEMDPSFEPIAPDEADEVPYPLPGGLTLAPPVERVSNPSFDCDDARTRSERMVCSSRLLASRDRDMAALFNAAMDDATPRQRRRLDMTRDRFLAYRERCPDDACIAETYEGRMLEIRDIMIDR